MACAYVWSAGHCGWRCKGGWIGIGWLVDCSQFQSNPLQPPQPDSLPCVASWGMSHSSFLRTYLIELIYYYNCPLCFVPWNLKEKKSFFSQREFVAFQNRRCIFCLACWSRLGFLKWKTLGWLFAEREDKLRRAEVTYSNERWYNYFVTVPNKGILYIISIAPTLAVFRTWSLRRKVWWRLFFHFFVR